MFLSKLMWRVSSINRHLFFIILYLLTVVFWVERVVSGFSRVYRRLTGVNAIDRAMEMSRESDDVAKFRKKRRPSNGVPFFSITGASCFFCCVFLSPFRPLIVPCAADRAGEYNGNSMTPRRRSSFVSRTPHTAVFLLLLLLLLRRLLFFTSTQPGARVCCIL